MAARKPRKTSKSKTRRPAKNSNRNVVLAFVLGVAAALVLLFAAQKYLPSYKSLTGLVGDPQGSVSPAKTRPAETASPAKPAQQTREPAKPQTQAQTQAPQTQTEASAQEAAKPQGETSQQPSQQQQAQPETGKAKALLAIVIDDLGSSVSQAEALTELRMPLTGSVLPGLPHTREVDALLAKAGAEVLLHQPMEAWNASPGAMGPGGLRSGMSAKEVARVVEANLAQTPHAVGMNNHMGSKGSEDAALMDAVMAVIKPRGLLFLDSKTSERSVAEKRAARAGVPALARAVFLDNERGQQSAILMLKEAERAALTKGRAVAIGHPHPETLAALAAWDIRRDQRVRLVHLSRLVRAN